MREIEKEILDKFKVGKKIFFKNLPKNSFDLELNFFLKEEIFEINKHILFDVGKYRVIEIYFDKSDYIQIIIENEKINSIKCFTTVEKRYLKDNFERALWLGTSIDRGLMFYDDYFFSKNVDSIFDNFLFDILDKNFEKFDDYDSIEYEIEDSHIRTNILEVILNNGFFEKDIISTLEKEIMENSWIIDYKIDEEVLEIYYHFLEEQLEKRYLFVRNGRYNIEIFGNNTSFEKERISSLFERELNSQKYTKEFILMNYDIDLSILDIKAGISIKFDNIEIGD